MPQINFVALLFDIKRRLKLHQCLWFPCGSGQRAHQCQTQMSMKAPCGAPVEMSQASVSWEGQLRSLPAKCFLQVISCTLHNDPMGDLYYYHTSDKETEAQGVSKLPLGSNPRPLNSKTQHFLHSVLLTISPGIAGDRRQPLFQTLKKVFIGFLLNKNSRR